MKKVFERNNKKIHITEVKWILKEILESSCVPSSDAPMSYTILETKKGKILLKDSIIFFRGKKRKTEGLKIKEMLKKLKIKLKDFKSLVYLFVYEKEVYLLRFVPF